MSARRASIWVAALLVLAAVGVLAAGYRNATADPQVRRLTLRLSHFPRGAPPVHILLFSDVHVHGPDMPPRRVRRIVEKINALRPDIIIAAGDFVGNSLVGRQYPVAQAIAPLAGLKARYGVYAVLGNNDYVAGAERIARELRRAGIHVLADEAAAAGPLAVGGLDGRIRRHSALVAGRRQTYREMEAIEGVKLFLTHRPDEFVSAPRPVALALSGHTHCGQILLPLFGSLETGSDYGRRLFCGLYRIGPGMLVVSAGLGTSYVPLRFGAPPDIWLITVEASPSQGQAASARNIAVRGRSRVASPAGLVS